MVASYADDYPHGKFYVSCIAPTTADRGLPNLDLPLEEICGGKLSFTNLDYPDNFFDVIVAGFVHLVSCNLTCRSIQFIPTKSEWPDVMAECYRVLKPG